MSRRPSRKPLDKDLYASVVAEAKRKFDVWPSAYASGWVVKTYKARGGRYAGGDRKTRSGLTKWFGESWVDLSRPIHDEDGELVGYEPCGRKTAQDASNDPAAYPKCRPLAEALRMSPSEVKDAIKRKRAAEAKAGRGGRGGRGARAPVRVPTYRKNPEGTAPSEATPTDVTRTKGFRRWFGDSKVVDEKGRPLVVFHGHPRNVDAFFVFDFDRAIDLGMHFGTQEAAFDIIGVGHAVSEDSPLWKYVRPFYLSLQNPLEMSDPGDWISSGMGSTRVPVLEDLYRKGVITAEEYEATYEKVKARRQDPAVSQPRAVISRLLRDLIVDAGYDGVVYENENEDVGSRSWVAFYPEQIKLADGTNTTFDPANPDVRLNPDVTSTPTFRRWFGDSKVVDAAGEPLVVYHGAPDVRGIFAGGFKRSQMRGDVFFATDDPRTAETYTDPHRAWDYQNAEPGVIPLYLRIENPLVVDAGFQHWRGTESVIEKARRAGHDGVIIENTIDHYASDRKAKPRREDACTVFAFFSPTQVKSALTGPMKARDPNRWHVSTSQPLDFTGPNDGTFDLDDADLRSNPYDPEDDPLSDVHVIATDELEDGTVVKYVASPFPYERKPLGYNDDPKVQGLVNLAALIGTQRRVSVAGVEKYLAGADEKPPRPGSSRMPAILVYETSDGRQYIADGHHRAFAALMRDMETFPAIIQLVRE